MSLPKEIIEVIMEMAEKKFSVRIINKDARGWESDGNFDIRDAWIAGATAWAERMQAETVSLREQLDQLKKENERVKDGWQNTKNCPECGHSPISYDKVEIRIDSKDGHYRNVSFEYCEECGASSDPWWYDYIPNNYPLPQPPNQPELPASEQ